MNLNEINLLTILWYGVPIVVFLADLIVGILLYKYLQRIRGKKGEAVIRMMFGFIVLTTIAQSMNVALAGSTIIFENNPEASTFTVFGLFFFGQLFRGSALGWAVWRIIKIHEGSDGSDSNRTS